MNKSEIFKKIKKMLSWNEDKKVQRIILVFTMIGTFVTIITLILTRCDRNYDNNLKNLPILDYEKYEEVSLEHKIGNEYENYDYIISEDSSEFFIWANKIRVYWRNIGQGTLYDLKCFSIYNVDNEDVQNDYKEKMAKKIDTQVEYLKDASRQVYINSNTINIESNGLKEKEYIYLCDEIKVGNTFFTLLLYKGQDKKIHSSILSGSIVYNPKWNEISDEKMRIDLSEYKVKFEKLYNEGDEEYNAIYNKYKKRIDFLISNY